MRRWLRVSLVAGLAVASICVAQDTQTPYPALVTAQTRADSKALAELQRPGTVLFSDGFDSQDSFKAYFEVGGLKEGWAKIVTDAAIVRGGKGALQLTAAANAGNSSGASVNYWFGPDGHDRVHIRYSIRFAADYDQGNLNHTGGGLSGVAGTNKWGGMGGAGIKPKGDDHFNSRLEAWRDWGRFAPPGYLFCYSYWMDMRIDKDGNYWGNMLGPAEEERFVPERGRWYCMELMVKANTVGKADGELAAWIDGKLALHYRGFRWRSTDAVQLKRASLAAYVHEARRDNTVWYDDFVVSTGYVGPVKASPEVPIRALKPPSGPLGPTRLPKAVGFSNCPSLIASAK